MRGLIDFVSGRARTIRKANETDAYRCLLRDRNQRQALIEAQLAERQELQQRMRTMLRRQSEDRTQLAREVVHYMRVSEGKYQEPDRGSHSKSRAQDGERGRTLAREIGRSVAPSPNSGAHHGSYGNGQGRGGSGIGGDVAPRDDSK